MELLQIAVTETGSHWYLSTSCLHGKHDHCQSTVNIQGGMKSPATCKWCPSSCVCSCHAEEKI